MSPDSIFMFYYYRKEKVLTMVGAFFVTTTKSVRFKQESLSVLYKKIKPGKGSIYFELWSSVLNHKMKSKIFKGLSEKTGQKTHSNQAKQKAGFKMFCVVVTIIILVISFYV